MDSTKTAAGVGHAANGSNLLKGVVPSSLKNAKVGTAAVAVAQWPPPCAVTRHAVIDISLREYDRRLRTHSLIGGNMLIRIVLVVAGLCGTCAAQATAAAGRVNPTFQALVQDAKSRIREMSPEQLKKLAGGKEKYALIDVREDHEWAAGHAAGAMHISRGTLEKGIESSVPQRNARIILYCHSGARSALAADTLQKMGYSDVYSLAGGFVAYEKSGLLVEK